MKSRQHYEGLELLFSLLVLYGGINFIAKQTFQWVGRKIEGINKSRLPFSAFLVLGWVANMIWKDQGLSIHLGLIGGEISWERPLGNDGLGRNLVLLILKGVVTTAPILWSLAILSIFAGWFLGALMVYAFPKLWVSALEKLVLKLGPYPCFC